jgi:hypothetical protein
LVTGLVLFYLKEISPEGIFFSCFAFSLGFHATLKLYMTCAGSPRVVNISLCGPFSRAHAFCGLLRVGVGEADAEGFLVHDTSPSSFLRKDSTGWPRLALSPQRFWSA